MLEFLLVVSVVSNVVLFFVAKRFIKRTLQFDALFVNVIDDLDVFIRYIDSLRSKSFLSNSPEVKSLNDNLELMRDRFSYFSSVFDGVSVRREEAPKKIGEVKRPPVVID